MGNPFEDDVKAEIPAADTTTTPLKENKPELENFILELYHNELDEKIKEGKEYRGRNYLITLPKRQEYATEEFFNDAVTKVVGFSATNITAEKLHLGNTPHLHAALHCDQHIRWLPASKRLAEE